MTTEKQTPVNILPFPSVRRFLASLIGVAFLASPSIAFAETIVNVSSLKDFQAAVQKSGQTIVLKPGSYKLTDLHKRSRAISCSGSDNKIDLTDVYLDAPVGSIRQSYFTISGSNNIIKGGTFEDTYTNGLTEITDFSAYNRDRSTLAYGLRGEAVIEISGSNNKLFGMKLTVRGSFPYGYGSIYGIGAKNAYGLNKRCGIRLHGKGNTVERCEVQMRSFGHGIYLQEPADDSLIKNCLVEGRLRAGKELLLETDPEDLPARSDYKSMDGDPIRPDVFYPLSEDGIRSYPHSGIVTVENCKVVRMRGGIRLYLAKGATVTNSASIDCGLTNYNMPKGGKIQGSMGNFAYAPLLDFRLSRSHQKIDMTILRSPTVEGPHNLADILGDNHKIHFRRQDGPTDKNIRPIVVSGKNSEIINETEYPIILQATTSGNTVSSYSEVTDLGTDNKVIKLEL